MYFVSAEPVSPGQTGTRNFASDHKGTIFWRGPVLAGNRLIMTSSIGRIAYVSPVDGSIIGEQDTRAPTSFAPVVANNTMYILEDNGRLTAWR